MTTNSKISHTVMQRVYTIHALRKSMPMMAASALLLVLALWALGREVWVAQVFANMPSLFNVPAIARFFASAFMHTDLAVQLFSVLALGAVIWLGRSLGRLLSRTARFV